MLFELNITGTDEDFLALEIFHALESNRAQKILKKRQITFVLTVIAILTVFVLIVGWTAFSRAYVIGCVVYAILRILLWKKIIKRNIKAGMKRIKQEAKIPFDPHAKYEFYEDKLVESNSSTRIEQTYNSLERICILRDRYILIYSNNASVYILPHSQVCQQLSEENFLTFLSQKCNDIEYY